MASKNLTLRQEIPLSRVANMLVSFLKNRKGLAVNVIERPDGISIKAKSPKKSSFLFGQFLSADIGLKRTGETVELTVGNGCWLDKIIMAALLFVPPLGIMTVFLAIIGVVKQLRLFKGISKETPRIISVIESGGFVEYSRTPIFARPVERLPIDNFFFMKCREFVFNLDNDIFNGNGGEGNHYQPATHVLILPFFCGVFLAICLFLSMFSKPLGRTGAIIVFAGLLLNIFLNRKNIFVLHGWLKKICYPIFIFIVSYFFLLIVCLLFSWLIVLVVVLLLLSIMFDSFKINAAAGASGGSGVGNIISKVKVVDGDGYEKTLTRDGVGDWHDDYGNRYTESFDGSFRPTL